MNQPTRPPANLPVLTEVLDVPDLPLPVAQVTETLMALPEVELSFPPASPTAFETPVAATPLEQEFNLALAERVRANVHLQLTHLLEAQLREAIAPLLAQYSDALVHRLNADLAQTLNDMVARAVDQEISQRHI